MTTNPPLRFGLDRAELRDQIARAIHSRFAELYQAYNPGDWTDYADDVLKAPQLRELLDAHARAASAEPQNEPVVIGFAALMDVLDHFDYTNPEGMVWKLRSLANRAEPTPVPVAAPVDRAALVERLCEIVWDVEWPTFPSEPEGSECSWQTAQALTGPEFGQRAFRVRHAVSRIIASIPCNTNPVVSHEMRNVIDKLVKVCDQMREATAWDRAVEGVTIPVRAERLRQVSELVDELAAALSGTLPAPAADDLEGQARSWREVFKLCCSLGMDSGNPRPVSGREMVLDFIRSGAPAAVGGGTRAGEAERLLDLAYALRQEYDVGDSEFGAQQNDAPETLLAIIQRLEVAVAPAEIRSALATPPAAEPVAPPPDATEPTAWFYEWRESADSNEWNPVDSSIRFQKHRPIDAGADSSVRRYSPLYRRRAAPAPEKTREPSEDSIADAIDRWHENDDPRPLWEALGWTREQYARWVENAPTLQPERASLSALSTTNEEPPHAP